MANLKSGIVLNEGENLVMELQAELKLFKNEKDYGRFQIYTR